MKRILLLPAFLFTHFFIHAQNITIEWDKTFGGDQFDNSAQLIATPDGGYLVAGSSDSNISDDKSENSKGSYDIWVLKLDSSGNKVWDKTLGGSEFDAIGDVTLTGDGGYLLVGHSNSSASVDKTGISRGLTDGWVIKLDGNGVVQWDKTIGGSGNDYLKQGLSISGGGYVLGGYSESNVSGEKSQNSKGSFDYWIIKIDENGNTLWDQTLGGETQETLADLIEAEDGGFLLAGNSSSSNSGDKSENSRGERDYWVVRVDQEGRYLWDKTYGGASEDLLTSVMLTGDGSYILAGNSNSAISGEKSENANNIDYWILKIDASGNLIWDNTIGGNGRDWTPFLCRVAAGGGYLLAGGSDSGIGADKSEGSRGQIDYWVVKIDEQGNKIWDKTLGGNSDDSISSIISTGSEFVLGGSSNSSISGEKTESNHNFYSDLWIVKMSDATPSISGLTLINAETDEDILTLTDGAEINLTDLPTTSLNIRANTTGSTSRVLLELSGALTNSRSEGVAPYALYGDTSGDYNAQEFIPGDYTLTATPFSGSSPGTPLSVQFSIVETAAPAPFVTTWKTDNPGVSDDNQITIPTFPGETYNYTVDWNDGTIDTNVTGDMTHTYAAPGIYQVSITGMFPRIYHEILDGVLNDSEKLLSVDQWGEQVWMSMEKAFAGCTNMDVLATDVPDLSQVNTMENMFSYCFSLVGNASFSQWNVSSVTNMSALFFENYLFNQDIGDWNVSNLVEASGMFAGAESFNQDIGAWNVSGIQYMGGMFNGATVFNQDISNWDVSNVTNFNNTFARTSFFNQDLSNWNVGNAIIFSGMFSEAIAFDQNISSWNVAKAVRMEFMFDGATSFNADISSWDVSRVTSMKAMFRNALVFNQDIGSWDVSKVTTMENMFANNALSRDNYDNTLIGWGNLPGLQNSVPFHAGNSIYCNGEVSRLRLIEDYGWIITDAGKDCPFITTWKTDNPGTSADNQITIPTNPQFNYNYTVDWGDGSSDTSVTGNITHTYETPGTYTVLISGDFPAIFFNNQADKEKLLWVDQWGDLSWISMTSAFDGCSNLDIRAQDTPDLSNVSQVSNMFSDCTSLVGTEAFGNWDMSNVTDMSGMFQGASAFNIYIGGWDVSSVSTMSYLFSGAEAFNQGIGNWDVGTVESMLSMFSGADHFDQDIGSWNVSNVSNMLGMFIGAISFNQDIGDWNTGKVTDMALMFFSAINFNQDISQWDTRNVTNLASMFTGAYAFNQDISSWDVSNVTNMLSMFANAKSFDHDLGSWNIANVANMSNMFLNVSLSRDHYDGILNGWSSLPSVKNGVSFHAGNSRYCEGAAARQALIDSYQWNITDGGEKCLGTVPFVTTWKTDNAGSSEDNQITIPTYPGENYNYRVDWGDGTSNTGITGDITHTYESPGTYTVSILGDFPRIYFNNLFNGKPGDDDKIISLDQWGTIFWTSMEYAFTGCENLQVTATDTPDLSEVTRMDYMFANCTSLVGNASFNDWELNNVQRISSIFFYATSFNANIGNWDVSNVVNMGSAFSVAEAFNQDIGNWSVGNVTSMDSMFSYATSFNQNIGNWDVSNVVYMSGMFYYAEAFDQNIGDWYLGNVIRMGGMFKGASSFNQNIGNWDVHNVTHMNAMFEEATVFNQDIGNWDVSNVFDMNGMFQHASAFNQDIGNWNVGNVTQFGPMFAGATSFNQNIGRWDVSKVTWMYEMFRGARSFDQDLGNWNVSTVTRMDDMFLDAGLSVENYDNLLRGWSALPSLQNGVSFHAGNSKYCSGAAARQNLINTYGWAITDSGENCPGDGAFITTWKTDNPGSSTDNQITIPTYPGETYDYTIHWGDATSDNNVSGGITHTYENPGTYQVFITGVFPRIYFNNNGFDNSIGDKDKILSIDQWGGIEWNSMSNAFTGCTNLNVLATDIPDLSNVSTMDDMFNLCVSLLGNPSIGAWDLSNVRNIGGMFSRADLFNQDIGVWDVSNVTNMSGLFAGAYNFNQDIGGWNVSNVTQMESLFNAAFQFNQDLSGWDVSNVRNMSGMFIAASSFNWDISGWDVSQVVEMNVMFKDARTFNQDLSGWNVSLVGDMTSMFDDSALSNENYDAILLGWSQLAVQNNVPFGANNTTYCHGENARQTLLDSYGWAITDGGENCPESGAFITTWKTNNPGYSEDNQITIPTYPGETYNYTVDWGDGTSDSGVSGDITHTYATPGTYQVSISGTFPQIFFNDNNGLDDIYPDREKILSIDQWGSIQWKSMNSAFFGCYNLDMLATDVPDLSQVTSLANMFNVCPSLVGNDSFREWDVSTITNMGAMFAGTNLFNIDIGNWDVGNVRAMSAMFLSALSFNRDIGSWNVGNVTDMFSMFLNAQSFNQDLSDWDVGNVTHMSSMFQLATSFNQPLGSWNVSKVTDMTNMFLGVTLSLEHYDNLLNGWANLPSLQSGVAFHGGNSEFCLAVEAHHKLIGKYGWAITDGGTECPGPGLTVTGLVLVDADTNQDIMPLTHGLLVYAGSLPTMNLNIRADTTDDTSSVSLALAGAIGGSRTENVAPFTLFGDSAGDYYAELFETGLYTMTATPYSDKNLGGTAGNALSVSFEITDRTPDCITFGISGVELSKVTDCNQPNGYARVEVRGATSPVTYSWSHDPDLNGPEAFNLSEGNYSLTYSDAFCSKEFTFVIDAALPEVSLEALEDVVADTTPFALTGGFPEGGVYSGIGVSDGLFDPAVGAGTYEITYSYTNASGCSNSVVQTLTVQAPPVLSVTGFILVDADTDQDIMAITNDMIIDMASLPAANLNIRASTTEDVQSVRLELGGQEAYGRTESTAPYALYGDNSGNYNGHVYIPGNYTLTVTPYSGNGLSGTQGTPGSINFTFISGGSGKGSITSGIKGYEVSLAPNSASTSVNVSLTDSRVKIKSILVHDLSGRKVGEFNAPDYLQGTDYVLPVYQFQSGIYLITTIDSKGTINQERLSVQN